jgi:hypothetical protein
MPSRLITVMSDNHKKEYDVLQKTADMFNQHGVGGEFMPAIVSRMSWLEYQAKLRVESILELCRTGK